MLWRGEIEKKEEMLWQRMFERKSVRLNQIGLDGAEVMSFYRFLNNPRVGLSESAPCGGREFV